MQVGPPSYPHLPLFGETVKYPHLSIVSLIVSGIALCWRVAVVPVHVLRRHHLGVAVLTGCCVLRVSDVFARGHAHDPHTLVTSVFERTRGGLRLLEFDRQTGAETSGDQ